MPCQLSRALTGCRRLDYAQNGRWSGHRPYSACHLISSPHPPPAAYERGYASPLQPTRHVNKAPSARLVPSTLQWPPIRRTMTQHERWQRQRPSHILGGPDLASNDLAQAVAAPPPILRSPRHGQPPISRAATQHRRW